MIHFDQVQFREICDIMDRIGSDITDKLQDIATHLEGIHDALIGIEAQATTETKE